MDILSSVLVTISCKIHKNMFIRVTEMQFFYIPPILPQESLLNLLAKDNDKNEARSCMLPPCCIEIVMSVFGEFWKGEEMQDTPGFQPHVLELLT